MAQAIVNTGVLVESVSQTAHTISSTLSAGTNRKAVVMVVIESGTTVSGATYNGQAMTAVAGATITNATLTDIKAYTFVYDIADGLTAGSYNIVATTAANSSTLSVFYWQTSGSATGAPEASDAEQWTTTATNATVNLTTTDGAIIFVGAITSAAAQTWAITGDATERTESDEANYTSVFGDGAIVTGGADSVTATVNSGGSGNKAFVGISVAAGPTGPTVTSVSANSGTVAGGTNVTITGTNFSDAGGSSEGVTFGGTAATAVTFVNATTITCTTPAHAAGPVNVVVTNGDGQSGTGTNAYFYEGVVTIVNPGPTDASGDATGTLTSTLWAPTGLAKRVKLTPTIGGVVCDPRCVKLVAP